MATVPISRGPQVRTAPLQFVPQQAAGSDAAFGGVQARQVEALGGSMQKAAADFDRIAAQKAQTQAFELDAHVTEKWLKWDAENRQRYRGANAEGYTAAVEDWWKKAALETHTGLDPRVKQTIGKSLSQRRLQALGAATAFVSSERERHATEAYAADVNATIEFGLATGTVASADQEVRSRVRSFAARKGWTTEQVQAETTKALTQLHGLYITRLLDTNPEAARAHLLAVGGELDARSRAGFERAVEQAGVLTKAQQLADGAMQRGLTLDQALKEAESLSGEAERVAKAELRQRYADVDMAKRQVLERAYGTALLEVEQRGRVKPTTFALLDDKHKAAVLNRMQAEAKAREAAARDRPIKTDWNVYANLREQADTNPQAFAKTDLRQYLDRIGPGQFEQLLDIQTNLKKPENDPKRRSEQTVSAQVSDFAAGLGMNSVKVGQFKSYVHDRIREYRAAHNDRQPSDAEVMAIMDGALLRPPGWFQDRTFETVFQQRKSAATKGTPTPAPAAPPPTPPVLVNTPAEARALPPGTRFQTPDGRILIAR